MIKDLLKAEKGRFFRGNLHCHSRRSDGVAEPEEVAAAYRDAGYDFICLSDHFEAEYGWQVTDTRFLRDRGFTTIVGAELSSGVWAGATPTRSRPPAFPPTSRPPARRPGQSDRAGWGGGGVRGHAPPWAQQSSAGSR